MILTGVLGRELVKQGRNKFVSASCPLMRELRRLKLILDRYGFQIKSEWIPSVSNKVADSLSRCFSRGDLQIQRQVRRSVMAGIQAPLDASPFRPLREHPQFLRRQAFRELAAPWEQDQVRLLCPPAELIGATVREVRATGTPVIPLIPDWPDSPGTFRCYRWHPRWRPCKNHPARYGRPIAGSIRLEATHGLHQSGIATRAHGRMALADAARSRMLGLMGSSAGAQMSLQLLTNYARSDRTLASRNSQWHTWVDYCTDEGKVLLPVTEAHLVGFIGGFASERAKGRHRVSSTSIPQYLSAVRQMQLILLGQPVPAYPFVWHVLRSYKCWEEEHFPAHTVRCGIPASSLKEFGDFGCNVQMIHYSEIVRCAFPLIALMACAIVLLLLSRPVKCTSPKMIFLFVYLRQREDQSVINKWYKINVVGLIGHLLIFDCAGIAALVLTLASLLFKRRGLKPHVDNRTEPYIGVLVL